MVIRIKRNELFSEEEKESLAQKNTILFFNRLFERKSLTDTVDYNKACKKLKELHEKRVQQVEGLITATRKIRSTCKKLEKEIHACADEVQKIVDSKKNRKQTKSPSEFFDVGEIVSEALGSYMTRLSFDEEYFVYHEKQLAGYGLTLKVVQEKKFCNPIDVAGFLSEFIEYIMPHETPKMGRGKFSDLYDAIGIVWLAIQNQWKSWHQPCWLIDDRFEIEYSNNFLKSDDQTTFTKKHDPAFIALTQLLLMFDYQPAKIREFIIKEYQKESRFQKLLNEFLSVDEGDELEDKQAEIEARLDVRLKEYTSPKNQKQIYRFVVAEENADVRQIRINALQNEIDILTQKLNSVKVSPYRKKLIVEPA